MKSICTVNRTENGWTLPKEQGFSLTCRRSVPVRSTVPNSYSLGRLARTNPPGTLASLQQWLSASSPNGNWKGKLYVASTISWNQSDFIQEGCSPNYQAGWWTLTCCKHDMRSGGPINAALSRPTEIAVFIFTLSRMDLHGNQHLVSVAKVTEHFCGMPDYAQRLIRSGDRSLISSRLTRYRTGSSLGWRFGDCHANNRGAIGIPYADHVHGINYGSSWHTDNQLGHTLLMSNCFLIWPKPFFHSAKTLEQSRYGHDITANNLHLLLK
jgi:hypothetical protein